MEPSLQKRIQRYGWDRAADSYEAYWENQLKPAQDLLLQMAELRPGCHVVDIACGTGLVTFRAAELINPGGSVIGTDISNNMITLANNRTQLARNAKFIRQGAEEFNFPPNSFDRALCALGLMYVVDPWACIELVKPSLKRGGKVISAVWGARKNCGWASVFPIVDAKVKTEVCPLFFHLGTGNTLEELYRKAGLVSIKVSTIQTTLYYASSEHAAGAVFIGGPVALAYSRFNREIKARCYQEYLESIECFRNENGYAIPGEFVVASGEKI